MRKVANPKDQSTDEAEGLRKHIAELQTKYRHAVDSLESFQTRNRMLGDSAPFGIFTTDVHGHITGSNRKMRALMNWPAGGPDNGPNILKDRAFIETGLAENFHRCIQTRRTIIESHPCYNTSGACLYLRYHFSPISNGDGEVLGVMAFVEDFTDLKLAEAAVRNSEERYRILFQSAPIALVERDAAELKQYLHRLHETGTTDFSAYLDRYPQEVDRCLQMITTVRCNRAFLDLMEAKSIEQVNTGLARVNPENFQQIARDIVMMVVEGDPSIEREQTFTTLKGNRRSVLVKSLAVTGHEIDSARFVISVVDITKRKAAEEALRLSEQKFRDQALRDNLTGLYNRRYLYQSLNGLIETGKMTGTKLSLIFMDLDHFKNIVDGHGHLNGSKAIRLVAGAIRESIEPPAYAVAYAGDEFVVVLPDTDLSCAGRKAAEIRQRLETTEFQLEADIKINIQASFGIATFPDHAEDVDELLAAADKALFSIKRHGKGNISLYHRPEKG